MDDAEGITQWKKKSAEANSFFLSLSHAVWFFSQGIFFSGDAMEEDIHETRWNLSNIIAYFWWRGIEACLNMCVCKKKGNNVFFLSTMCRIT